MTTLTPLSPDTDVFALYAEYTGVPLAVVAECAANFRAFNMVSWHECRGQSWHDKAKVYYERHEEYLFDLLNGSRNRARRRAIYQQFGHWQHLRSAGPEVIEFGGGLGLTCSLLRDEGKRVTYLDVDGPAARFARWYFERTGQTDIEMLSTPSTPTVLPAGRQWDLVFSDSVVEHVTDPAATVDTLARATRAGGLLYLIIDAHDTSPGFPMHQHVAIAEVVARSPALQAMRHEIHDGDTLNAFRAPRDGAHLRA